MLQDRRKTERHALRGLAKIQNGAGSLPRDCIVTDVSDGGVRLFAEGVEVPEEFVLVFGATRESRECRVMWRLGYEVGAEFIDTTQRDFARNMLSLEIARSYADQQELHAPPDDVLQLAEIDSRDH
jgi:PilZ domain-containing protein